MPPRAAIKRKRIKWAIKPLSGEEELASALALAQGLRKYKFLTSEEWMLFYLFVCCFIGVWISAGGAKGGVADQTSD